MKVLRPGNKDHWRWIGECTNCGAIVEATTGEIRPHIQRGDYRSDGEDFAWVRCPECINKICFHKVDTKSGQRVKEKLDAG